MCSNLVIGYFFHLIHAADFNVDKKVVDQKRIIKSNNKMKENIRNINYEKNSFKNSNDFEIGFVSIISFLLVPRLFKQNFTSTFRFAVSHSAFSFFLFLLC